MGTNARAELKKVCDDAVFSVRDAVAQMPKKDAKARRLAYDSIEQRLKAELEKSADVDPFEAQFRLRLIRTATRLIEQDIRAGLDVFAASYIPSEFEQIAERLLKSRDVQRLREQRVNAQAPRTVLTGLSVHNQPSAGGDARSKEEHALLTSLQSEFTAEPAHNEEVEKRAPSAAIVVQKPEGHARVEAFHTEPNAALSGQLYPDEALGKSVEPPSGREAAREPVSSNQGHADEPRDGQEFSACLVLGHGSDHYHSGSGVEGSLLGRQGRRAANEGRSAPISER